MNEEIKREIEGLKNEKRSLEGMIRQYKANFFGGMNAKEGITGNSDLELAMALYRRMNEKNLVSFVPYNDNIDKINNYLRYFLKEEGSDFGCIIYTTKKLSYPYDATQYLYRLVNDPERYSECWVLL